MRSVSSPSLLDTEKGLLGPSDDTAMGTNGWAFKDLV